MSLNNCIHSLRIFILSFFSNETEHLLCSMRSWRFCWGSACERASGKAAKSSGEALLPIPFSALPLVFAVSPLARASSPSKPPATQAIIIHLNLAYNSSLSPLFKRLTECFRIDLFEESNTKVPWSSGCQLPHPLSPLPPPRNKHTTSRKRQFCFFNKVETKRQKERFITTIFHACQLWKKIEDWNFISW